MRWVRAIQRVNYTLLKPVSHVLYLAAVSISSGEGDTQFLHTDLDCMSDMITVSEVLIIQCQEVGLLLFVQWCFPQV